MEINHDEQVENWEEENDGVEIQPSEQDPEDIIHQEQNKIIYGGLDKIPKSKKENFQNFKGKIQIFKKNFWTGNPSDRLSQGFTVFAFIFINLHFYHVIGAFYELKYNLSAIKYVSLPFIAFIGYNIYKCFVTEPGALPRGQIMEDPLKKLEDLEKQENKENGKKCEDNNDCHSKKCDQQCENENNNENLQTNNENLNSFRVQYDNKAKILRELSPEQDKLNFDKADLNTSVLNTSVGSGLVSQRNVSHFMEDNSTNRNNNENEENNNMIEKQKKQLKLKMYDFRYCSTCQILRPPKSSHCGRCDMCVMEFDHHCFFIGNCVGLRNIKYFLNFLVALMIYALYVIAVTVFMGYVTFSQQEDILEKIDSFPKSKYFFIFTCFLQCWGTFMGCPRRCYPIIGKLFKLSLIILLFQLGSGYFQKDDELTDGEIMEQNQEDQEGLFEYLGKINYVENPASVIIQMFMNITALGVAAPLACGTAFNVSRGITSKERMHLDSESKHQFSYQITFKQLVKNIIKFYQQAKPSSFFFEKN